MNWDWAISIVILVFFFLIVWSKVEQQSMKETLNQIKEFIQDFKGDGEELAHG